MNIIYLLIQLFQLFAPHHLLFISNIILPNLSSKKKKNQQKYLSIHTTTAADTPQHITAQHKHTN
jgi:hypothetical protein